MDDPNRYILWSFRRCPYAMRARMALAASEIDITLREVALRNKPPEMLDVSPKGTVPVLQGPYGFVLEESLEIGFWALDLNDPQGWLAPWGGRLPEGWGEGRLGGQHLDDPLSWDGIGVPDADTLIGLNDSYFKHHLDRYKYTTRYEGADAETHYRAGQVYLRALEQRLQRSMFLHGERFTFLDAAIFPFVRQFRIADMDRFDEEAPEQVRRWVHGLLSAPVFLRVMEKYTPWLDAGDEYPFPPEAMK